MPDSEAFRRYLPQILACILASNGAFVAGTNIGWSSQSQDPLQKRSEFDFSVSTDQFSWISSLLTLGGACGAPLCSLLVNRIGRKMSILAIFVPFVAGWVLIICAQSVMMMCIGRFVLGICCGGYLVVVPIYICEVAEKNIRGTLASFLQLFIVIGIEFAYILGALLNVTHVSIILLFCPLGIAVPFLWMPETPAYLVSIGRFDDARKNMRFLYGKDFDLEGELVTLTSEAEKRKLISFRVIILELRQFVVWYALLIAIGLQTFQQLSGINAIIFFVTDIFKKAMSSDSTIKPSHGTGIVGAIQIVLTSIAMCVVDHMGRKILLIVSGTVMALCTFLIGIYFFLANTKDVELPGYVPLIIICVYIALFCLGFGPVTWIICGEIFTPSSKEFGCGIAVFVNWFLAFVVTRTYEVFANTVGVAATFWIYTCISILGVVFVIFVVIETKGLALSEITQKLEERKRPSTVKFHSREAENVQETDD